MRCNWLKIENDLHRLTLLPEQGLTSSQSRLGLASESLPQSYLHRGWNHDEMIATYLVFRTIGEDGSESENLLYKQITRLLSSHGYGSLRNQLNCQVVNIC